MSHKKDGRRNEDDLGRGKALVRSLGQVCRREKSSEASELNRVRGPSKLL